MGTKHDLFGGWIEANRDLAKEWYGCDDDEKCFFANNKKYRYLDVNGVYYEVAPKKETVTCGGICSICKHSDGCTYYDPDHCDI